jgi:hypothetical protein
LIEWNYKIHVLSSPLELFLSLPLLPPLFFLASLSLSSVSTSTMMKVMMKGSQNCG